MKQINSILIISFVLTLFSCNSNYSNQEEYNVINAVGEERGNVPHVLVCSIYKIFKRRFPIALIKICRHLPAICIFNRKNVSKCGSNFIRVPMVLVKVYNP